MSRHLNPYTRLLLLFFYIPHTNYVYLRLILKKPHKILFTISMDVNRS